MLTTRLDISRLRAPAARRPAPAQLGTWRLVSLLGTGAWSRVYKAQPADSPADRPADYALKVAHLHGPHAAQAAAFLRREAQVGRSVSHPHLAPILAFSLDTEPCFVVSPRLEGVTLAAALAAGQRPSLPHALWIVRQTAEALGALHSEGWLHGDVKPGNIIISARGHATLIDLGFARRLDERTGRADHALLATLAYAAPEVFTNTVAPSAFSDVYSLGVVLFEMLTGQLPFLATDPTDLAVAHLQQIPPDARTLAPHLPPRIGWLLKRMLAKEPLRRPDISELISLLVELEVETFTERA